MPLTAACRIIALIGCHRVFENFVRCPEGNGEDQSMTTVKHSCRGGTVVHDAGGTDFRKHICTVCNFVYEEEKGHAVSGIEALTPFQHIPEFWTCPECGASKDMFQPCTCVRWVAESR